MPVSSEEFSSATRSIASLTCLMIVSLLMIVILLIVLDKASLAALVSFLHILAITDYVGVMLFVCTGTGFTIFSLVFATFS